MNTTEYDHKVTRLTHANIVNRTDLAKLFAERGYKVGAEIGVETGDYAEVLCRTIPNLKYYGIDSWYVGDMKNHKHRGQHEHTLKKLFGYDATLIQKFSLDAVKDFDKSSLDFVYIDANHEFDNVMMDIIEWTKKVKKGGIISGHDYQTRCGVIPAVDAYVYAHSYRLNLTTDTDEVISWWFDKLWNS